MPDSAQVSILGPALWQKLAAGPWERTAALFPGAVPEGLGSLHALFEGVLRRAAGGPYSNLPPLKLYRGHSPDALHLPDPEWADYAPVREDGDLVGYLRRLAETTGEGELGFIVNHVHALDPKIHRDVCRLLDLALESLPFPSGGTTSAAFFGTYRRTQVGIHCDNMNVLVVPVLGRKTFQLWPRDVLRDHPAVVALGEGAHASKARIPGLSPDDVAHLAERIEVGPTDLLYIPKGMWHVASPQDQVNASFHVVLLSREPPRPGFEQVFLRDGRAHDLPAREFAAAQSRELLAWRSAQGLLAWPPPVELPHRRTALVCVAPRGCRVAPVDAGVEVVAGGRVHTVRSGHPSIDGALRSILSGDPFAPETYPGLREFIDALVRTGVLTAPSDGRHA